MRYFSAIFLLLLPGFAWAAVSLELAVEGVDGALHENVLESLTLYSERKHPLLELRRMRALHRQAEDEIRAALRPFGYYRPAIEASLEEQDGRWIARYRIDAGEPVRVHELVLNISGEAASDKAFIDWKQSFPLRPGDVLIHTAYEQGKRALQDLLRDRGYFEAQLQRHAIEVRQLENSARIVLEADSGPRYRFGAIEFSQIGMNDALLRSYLPFHEGDFYDAERLFALQRALTDSDYFDYIDVQAGVETAAEGVAPVTVDLRLRKRTRYTLGLGYGTDTGPRLGVGMERRYINRAGHRVTLDALTSKVQNRLQGMYRIPLQRHPNADYISFRSGWEQENLDVSKRKTLTAGAGLTMLLGRWQRTYALTFQQERFRVADQQNTTHLVLPSWSLQRMEADDRLFPSRGWRLDFELRGASETLGSDASLLQGVARAKAIYPLFGGRFITRADFGASKTSSFERVPASLRFFAGGDNSIRGYGYKTLGPRNAQGEVIGGRNLLAASAEYEHYFGAMFGAAAFYDAGNAFDRGDFKVMQGAGAGLRWRLPFGVLRVDIGVPLNVGKDHWRLHITLGPDL